MSLRSHLARIGLVSQFAIAFFVVTVITGAFLYTAVKSYAHDTVQSSSLALMSKARDAVLGRIDAHLSVPESIVAHNAALASSGALPLHDELALSRIFLRQLAAGRYIDYLYFANESGAMVSAGDQYGKYVLMFAKGMKRGDLVVQRVEASGKVLAHERTVADFDPRQRQWFASVKEKRRLFWSEPYAGTLTAPLAITTAYPLLGPSGELQGVFGADVLLDEFGEFLKASRISPNARVMLVEPDGTLVANSTKAPLFAEKNGQITRLKADTVPQPFAREVSGLAERMHRARQTKPLSTVLHDATRGDHYLDISPYARGEDIRWYLVMIVPRSDFTGPLDALWSRFLIVFLCGMIGALALSRVMAWWVTRPMLSINESVKEVAGGNFGRRVETRRRDEVGQLANSFNDMSERLASTYEEVRQKNEALDAANRDLAALLERERIRRAEAEAEGRRAHVLGEATAALSATQDYEGVLRALTRALVCSFVDWAVIDVTAAGSSARSIGAHADPSKDALLREFLARQPAALARLVSSASELRARAPLHLPVIGDEQIRSWCTDEQQVELVVRLGTRSALIVPLVARDTELGALALVSASSGRFEQADLDLVEELARRAALALDNARLYADLQRENAERRQAEAARSRSEEQLRQAQKMDAVGNLAGGIAHDFNNLLSVILGYSNLLAQNMAPSDPRRQEIEEIDRAGVRAAALTQKLLAFGRKQLRQPKIIRLCDVVIGIEPMLRRLIGEDVELRVATSSELGRVQADPSQIEQIIMNLAVNARDAMPEGGKLVIETANVDLDEKDAAQVGVAPGRHVMLSVSDTGTGMDWATRERMFEPFFTTKEKGKGTGLGLSTVFGIVQQSGGNVWVDSELGKGTVFKVYLPRTDAPLSHESNSLHSRIETLNGTETILLVEDEEQVRVLVRTILQHFGYDVIEAQTGGDALLVGEEHVAEIDLLLTDVVMPRISGPELAGRLCPRWPNMKVLYISGYTEEDSIVRRGMVDASVALLQKPITPKTLARKVREVLDAPPGAFRPPES